MIDRPAPDAMPAAAPVPLSVLDLAPVAEGTDVGTALHRAADVARHAERLGFHRYWLAEHHGMPGVASAATAVLLAHVAAATTTIRVGAGGIMLPNHAPLVVAEQFGTLAALHPGRVDLGLGRAPGSDALVARALRRDPASADRFPDDVRELMAWLAPARPGQAVRAVPGEGLDVPIWILGSSLYGAQLAAAYGLPFAFASHFAPAQLDEALAVYRAHFEPSAQLDRPHVMVAANVVCAESAEEAARLATSLEQAFVNLRRGRPGLLPPPVPGFADALPPYEREMLRQVLACRAVGTPDDVAHALSALVARTGADELILASQVHDHAARLRSYALVAEVAPRVGRAPAPDREPGRLGPPLVTLGAAGEHRRAG